MPNLISAETWYYVVKVLGNLKRDYHAFERIIAPLELQYDAALTEAFYHTQEAAIKTLSKLIGDDQDWLLWFVYDNNFGDSGLEVSFNNGVDEFVCNGYMDLKKILDLSYNYNGGDYE